MSLSGDVYTVCANNSALTNLVDDRIYLSRQITDTCPQLVYHAPIAFDNVAYRTQNEPPGRAVHTVQFDCYGETANDAESVADALIALWDGYQSDSPDIGYAFVDNKIDDGYSPTLENYRIIVDVTIETGL